MIHLTRQDILAHQASVPWPEPYQMEHVRKASMRVLRPIARLKRGVYSAIWSLHREP
jgi:hypothetical protein